MLKTVSLDLLTLKDLGYPSYNSVRSTSKKKKSLFPFKVGNHLISDMK